MYHESCDAHVPRPCNSRLGSYTPGNKFCIQCLVRQQFPQPLRSLKHPSFNRDNTTCIYHHRRITYRKHIAVLTHAILGAEKTSLVHVRHQVGTSYRAGIFPTLCTGLILYVIGIFIVTIFIFFIFIINSFLFRGFIFEFLNSIRRN